MSVKTYDVIVVGAGASGVMTAYELVTLNPNLEVLVVDKGVNIFNRTCPIITGHIEKCPPSTLRKDYAGCFPACSITAGFGGAGAYSDGKFNKTTEFGGWLTDYLSNEKVMELIDYVDQINLKHGAPEVITDPYTDKVRDIESRANKVGLKLLRARVRHIGTEKNIEVLKSIYNYLSDKVTFAFRTKVSDIVIENGIAKGILVETRNGEELYAISRHGVVVSPGRDGSTWLMAILKKNGVKTYNNQIDVGVRVEVPNYVMKEINETLYEGKFIYRTIYGTKVRTFCSNPSGHVVVENHSGIMNVNGHSYNDPALGSENTNFALLVSLDLPDAMNANEYAQGISLLANNITNGGVIVQRYGDFWSGVETKSLDGNNVTPTLGEAVLGNLNLVLPETVAGSLVLAMDALDAVSCGVTHEDTLFYGVEAKYYSARPELDSNFETKIKGLYCSGDGSGISRGLAQASASGIQVARHIVEVIK